MPTELKIHELRIDGGTQPRAMLDGPTVMEYAETMERGVELPPVSVMYDGENYWLYDGFHRVKAAQNIDRTTIRAEIKQGTKEDAQWESLAANKAHGLRRSQADKRRVIKRALKGWGSNKSDRAIARHVGCSPTTVGKYREDLSVQIGQIEEREVTRNGKTYTQDTSNIGTSQDTPDPAPMQTGGPSRRRRRDMSYGEPQWEDDFDPDRGEEEDLPTKNDVIRKITGEVAKIDSSEGMKRLRNFRDEQHLFSEEDCAEVLEVTRNLIERLGTAAEQIRRGEAKNVKDARQRQDAGTDDANDVDPNDLPDADEIVSEVVSKVARLVLRQKAKFVHDFRKEKHKFTRQQREKVATQLRNVSERFMHMADDIAP